LEAVKVASSRRRTQVGARYAAGGIGLGSMGMYNNRNQQRAAPRPMTRARPGSGRNP